MYAIYSPSRGRFFNLKAARRGDPASMWATWSELRLPDCEFLTLAEAQDAINDFHSEEEEGTPDEEFTIVPLSTTPMTTPTSYAIYSPYRGRFFNPKAYRHGAGRRALLWSTVRLPECEISTHEGAKEILRLLKADPQTVNADERLQIIATPKRFVDPQHEAIAQLQQWETNPVPTVSAIRNLQVICVQQQRQIEMLARIVTKLAPELYSDTGLAKVQGLPDIMPDIEDGDTEDSPESPAEWLSAKDIEPFDPAQVVEDLRSIGKWATANKVEALHGAWMRTVEAYRVALPCVDDASKAKMHVVSTTIFNIWGPKLVGTPTRDDAQVLREYAADRAFHKREDREVDCELTGPLNDEPDDGSDDGNLLSSL